MGITHHPNVTQGSDEWLALRCGLLTASEMKLVITPTLKIAANDKQRAHLCELVAQRISGYVEPHYISDDMLRGQDDEWHARDTYAKNVAPVEECGFITNDRWGFTLGYSPDGLVGADGLIECKSRRQKYQIQTIANGVIPEEYWMQVQTGLLVSEREWLDFVSYCGGLPMCVIRVHPDDATQQAILEASAAFEEQARVMLENYNANLRKLRTFPTERREIQEMFIG